ncbi:amino acid permease [uncultured Megasphaera sp.]|nr:amino acid permease [uncultured Megasphaera sp.]
MSFFHTKSVAQLHADSENSNLSKDLGVMDLTFLGVGGIIGAGIFVLTGIAAAKYAGPAISISFALAGLLCILVGLAYSEFASMIPSSGSVYSYTFASLGEGMAFLTGWSLLLGYTVTGSAVAVGFSGYLAGILKSYGYIIPEVLLKTPAEGGIINLPAVIIILLLALVLIRGTEQSAKLNTALVFITLAAIISFICIATPHVEMANFEPFAPFGVQGILSGTAIVFFSYMGFDAVATSAEECKKPERNLPIGIILSVFICMCLYVAMALSLTGAINYTDLNTPEPVAHALRILHWPGVANLVAVGAIAGITTVLLVLLYGQARIFFAMSRDGMVPARVCKIHKRYHTPYIVTVMGGIFVSIIAGFVPIGVIAEMANIGTLSAFLVAAIGVLVLRITKPDVPRTFRCPLVWLIAPLAVLTCGYLMYHLPWETWVRFIVWCTFGCLVYFGYSYQHSALAHPHDDEE